MNILRIAVLAPALLLGACAALVAPPPGGETTATSQPKDDAAVATPMAERPSAPVGTAPLSAPVQDQAAPRSVAASTPAAVTTATAPRGLVQTPAAKPSLPLAGLNMLPGSPATNRQVAALIAPGDLWERIRRGFAMPNLDSDPVRERELWYASRPEYIQRMTERSRKYLFHIVEELELRNMPSELALLPFVESAFNPQAVSSARAAGMWQFMPATGKDFELKQNTFRDDRRDVLASTRAALDYLQKLHGMFGDWHLALAAYNWGEGSVARAIEKNRRAGLATHYLALSMPAETRLYVPKLQAIKNIIAAPQTFSASLPVIDNHPYFQSVAIGRDIDVALAAKLAQVDLDDFKALNPSASRPVILAAGTPQILLPWDNAAIFQTNLQAYGGAQLASWTAWVAPAAMKPADAAKRVGMTEAELRSINQIPLRMVIQSGSTLLVRRSAAVRQDVAENVADNGQLSLRSQPLLMRRTVQAGKNESVASLAKRYDVAPASVAQWNRVAPTAALKAGQRLTLYLPAQSTLLADGAGSSKSRIHRRGKGKAVQVAKR